MECFSFVKIFISVLLGFLVNYSSAISAQLVQSDSSTLHAVVVLFRHGDRNPESSWPTDRYFHNTTLWKAGYGQLTNKGKMRHYELGQWFRNRYSSFLPSQYNASDVYVRSTDVDRTIMSAQANLAGLYTPEDDQVWNRNVLWQPIPVHVVPLESDTILSAEIPCPKHTTLQNQVFSDFPELQNILDEYQNVMENISNLSGNSDPSTFSIYSVSGIYSTTTIYRGMNLSLPQWNERYYPQMRYLSGVKFALPTYSIALARLRTGPFFDYLLKHFDAVKSQVLEVSGMEASPNRKFLMLSAHDTTVADVANSMGVYDGVPIEFATSLIWELRSIGNEFFLNMYFKNSTNYDDLVTQSCDLNCPLEEFREILKPITIDEETWRKECLEEMEEYQKVF